MDGKKKCKSIKSKKHPTLRCPNKAVKGDWCAVHSTSQIPWKSSRLYTQESAAHTIHSFCIRYIYTKLFNSLGPAFFNPELAENDKDIYSYDSVKTIPLVYRFSYRDLKEHIWLFDIRFLIQLLQYGKDILNPFTQEPICGIVLDKLRKRSSFLSKNKLPIVYINNDILTQEQLWNQKVLDVFLILSSFGYGMNVTWFEMMNPRAHELFYEHLYDLWMFRLNLTEEVKQSVIPGYDSGRVPLFRFTPHELFSQNLDIRWWRKMNLNLMKTFITRASTRDQQSLGALYILTALAEMHPRVRTAFPWLVHS